MRTLYIALLLLLASIGIVSCKKDSGQELANETNSPQIDSTALYKMILTGTWKMPQHVVPASNHFTDFIGLVHSDACALFKLGTLASKGVEDIAERGNAFEINKEMDAYINANKAKSKFLITLSNITTKDSTTLNATIKNSRISFESMIAPSPDWFVGLDSYDLLKDGKWVTDISLPLYGYDAGTEDGDVFGYANPATVPQQPISLMTPTNASVIANGNVSIAPFATVRFIKL
jgi:Spondin_N